MCVIKMLAGKIFSSNRVQCRDLRDTYSGHLLIILFFLLAVGSMLYLLSYPKWSFVKVSS